MAQISVDDIAAAVDGHAPSQIAAGIARLFYEGDIEPGDRMPVVRDLARRLSVSAGTVAAAWKILAGLGLVESRGRTGTLLLPPPNTWLPHRYRGDSPSAAQTWLDLSGGTPDPDLLPDIGRPLSLIAQHHPTMTVRSYFDPPVYPELGRFLQETWPYHAQRITVTSGAGDALFRTLSVTARYGDRVAVENPGYPPLFEVLDALGLVAVPLAMDASGVTCGALRTALKAGVRAVVVQPRAQNPTGVSMTTTRVRALAAVLRSIDEENRPLVVEDDHSAGIVRAKEISIGQFLPTDVVHIRSYSKTHGPDFRLAALGGPAEIVNAITARGLVGSGWTSHLLQMLLMEMLTDPTAKGQVRRAAVEYRWRRRALTDALAQKGVHVEPGGDGLTVWVPVRDEQAAHNHLLAAGIRTSLGRQFLVSEWLQTSQRRRSGHLRITLGALKDEAIGTVAEILAKAAAIR